MNKLENGTTLTTSPRCPNCGKDYDLTDEELNKALVTGEGEATCSCGTEFTFQAIQSVLFHQN